MKSWAILGIEESFVWAKFRCKPVRQPLRSLWRAAVEKHGFQYSFISCQNKVHQASQENIPSSFFFFPKDQHVYKVSMALMPGKGVSSALMSEEHLICIFNILYFWSVNPFKKMIKQMDNVCLIGHKEAVFLQVKFKLNEV